MKRLASVAALAAIALNLAVLASAYEQISENVGGTVISHIIATAVTAELGIPAESVQSIPEESNEPVYARVVYEAPAETEVPVPEPSIEPISTTIGKNVKFDNDTGFDIDPEALMDQGLDLTLPADSPQILIMHTHGSEAYTPDRIDTYEPSDPSRTEDTNYNVVRVGDELQAVLESYGLSVLHDRSLYDYPSYTGSYTRSGEAVSAYLEQYPDIAIVIDLHRDAIGSGDTVYKTAAEIPGVACAQVMILVGTGENGLYHPNWQENLKLAFLLQDAASGEYPTLMRPVAIKSERYNQQLTTGSLIVEVGSSGNTLQEAITAVKLFGQAIAPQLLELVETP